MACTFGIGVSLLAIGGPEMLRNSFLTGFNEEIGNLELPTGDLRIAAESATDALQNTMSTAELVTLSAGFAALTVLGFLTIARFRFRSAVGHTVLLATLAALMAKAVMAARANAAALKSAGAPDNWHLNGDWATLVVSVFAIPLAILMIWQVVPLIALTRHRLRADWPPTWRLTQSLGENLGFDKVSLKGLSPQGVAVQTAAAGALVYVLFRYPLKLFSGVLLGTWALLLFAAQIIGLVVLSVMRFVRGEPVIEALAMSSWSVYFYNMQRFAIIIVGTAVLMMLWRLGQRLNRRHRDKQILETKPAVLLLRSFMDDDARIRPNSFLWRLIFRRKRLEECIAEELSRAGPFFAIGKPGESLPPLGAERVYLSDDTWQDAVLDFMLKAERIVMVAGKTHWVQWELNKVLEQRGMGKLVMVLPPESADERTARWSNLRPPLGGTAWTNDLAETDAARVIAVVFGPTGATAITGGNVYESDYETALRVATYVMQNPH